jgi:hypothetical protein
MAKSEGRGWRKYLPSVATVVKVFVAMTAIKLVETVALKYAPSAIQPYLPDIT